MVNDAPDWTDNINIVGSTVTLNIAIQSSAIILNVNIASSAATLNVNLTASSITLNININGQSVAVQDLPFFQTSGGQQLFFVASPLQVQNVYVNVINLTPAGPAHFFLCGYSYGCITVGAAGQYISGRITLAGTETMVDTSVVGGRVVMQQPIDVGVGVLMNFDVQVNNNNLGNVNTKNAIWGYYK